MEQLYVWAFDALRFVNENPIKVLFYLYIFFGVIRIKEFSDTINMALNEPVVILKVGNQKWILKLCFILSLVVMMIFSPAMSIFFFISRLFRRK